MSDVITRKATILKVEVEIHPEFHRILVTPRDSDSDSLANLDAIYHALMTTQPRRGKYIPGTSGFVVDVKTADTDPAV